MQRLISNKENIIGIIGGSGPEATGLLYKNIFEIARTKYGVHRLENYPALLIASIPILQDVANDVELAEVITSLCTTADSLKAAGAKQLCLACNTHHLSIDTVQRHVGLPFISMVDLVQRKIRSEGYQSVAVIGTTYTLSQELYRGAVEGSGVKIVELSEELAKKSHALIGEALAGIPNELTSLYVGLVREVASEHSFDALILGCTEYSVLEDRRKQDYNDSLPIPIIDPLYELALAINKSFYK